MITESSSAHPEGGKYAVSFKEKHLGSTCDIEVEVNLATKSVMTFLSMRPFFKSSPPFRISRDDLARLSGNIKLLNEKAGLLETMPDGGEYQQLTYHAGGVSVIVVHPVGSNARYSLSIGSFNRSGLLSELSSTEIDAAVSRMDELAHVVLKRVS